MDDDAARDDALRQIDRLMTWHCPSTWTADQAAQVLNLLTGFAAEQLTNQL